MSLDDTIRDIEQAGAQAADREADAFNQQYAMTQRAQRAVVQMTAAGEQRRRQFEAMRVAEQTGSARFGAQEDQQPDARPRPSSAGSAPLRPSRHAPPGDDADNVDEEVPGRWLS